MRFAVGDVIGLPASLFPGYSSNLVFDGKVAVRIIAKHERLPYYSVEVDICRGSTSLHHPSDWIALEGADDKITCSFSAPICDSEGELYLRAGSLGAQEFHPVTYVPFGAKKVKEMEDFKLGDVVKIPIADFPSGDRKRWVNCTDADDFVKTRILAMRTGDRAYALQGPDGPMPYDLSDFQSGWAKLLGASERTSAYFHTSKLPASTVKVTCMASAYNPNYKYQLGEAVWIDGHQVMIVAHAKSTHGESRYIVEKVSGSFEGVTMPTAQGTILQHHVRKKDGFWTWIDVTRPQTSSYGLGCADDNIQTKPPIDQKKESTMSIFDQVSIGDEITAKYDDQTVRGIVFGKVSGTLLVEHPLGCRVTNPSWLNATFAPTNPPSGQRLLQVSQDIVLVKHARNVVKIGDRVSAKIGGQQVGDAIVYAISKDRQRVAIGHHRFGNLSERTPDSEWDVAEWEGDFAWKYMLEMNHVTLELSGVRQAPHKPQPGDVYLTNTGHTVTIIAVRDEASDFLCVFEPGAQIGWTMDEEWRKRNPGVVVHDNFKVGTYQAYFFAKTLLKKLVNVVGDSQKEEKVQVNEVKKSEGFVQMCKDDMEEAAYRGAARQITKGTRAILVMFLKSQGAKKSWIKAIVEMSESDWGCSMISWGLGVALTYAPHLRENAHCMILAKEFRVEGLGSAISQVGDVFRKQFEPMILGAIANLPTPPAEKLRILEEEMKGRRVAESPSIINEVKAEQEAIATEAAMKEQKQVATATV